MTPVEPARPDRPSLAARRPSRWRWMVVAVGRPCAASHRTPRSAGLPAERVQIILHMLDYMVVDYPVAVKDGKVRTGEYDAGGVRRAGPGPVSRSSSAPERAALTADPSADRAGEEKRPGDTWRAGDAAPGDHYGVWRRGCSQAAARPPAAGRLTPRSARCATAPRGGATGRRARASTLRPRISTMARGWRSEASTASTAASRSASAERA